MFGQGVVQKGAKSRYISLNGKQKGIVSVFRFDHSAGNILFGAHQGVDNLL
jgi:hypothetical protein